MAVISLLFVPIIIEMVCKMVLYNQRSIYLTPDGKFLLGGQGGLDIIDPRKMGRSWGIERPVFSGLKISGYPVALSERKLMAVSC